MELPNAKRRKSNEGLLGLLGAYGSEEEDEEEPASPSGDVLQAIGSLAAEAGEPLSLLPGSDSIPNAAPDMDELSEPLQTLEVGEERAGDEAQAGQREEDDPFWLPPEIAQAPESKCKADVQDIVKDYINVQEEKGITITASLRALRAYKNPDFLQHSVEHDSIDQYGSCYPKDIFDPHGLPKEDFYDRLLAEWEQFDKQRKEGKQKTEFVRGGTETMRGGPAGLSSNPMAATLVAQGKVAAAGRASKWDSSSRR